MKELLVHKNEIIVVLIIVLFFFVIRGIVNNHEAQMRAIEQERKTLKGGQALMVRYGEVVSQRDGLEKAFPIKDAGFLKGFIEQRSRAYGISISYIGPSQQVRQGYQEVEMSLKVSFSHYDDLVDFLAALEDSKIKVSSVEIKNLSRDRRETKVVVKSFILDKDQ